MSHSAAIHDRKQALREYALARRRSARRAAGPGAGVRAANHYLAAVPTPQGAVVSGYWAIRDEIDAMPLLARLVGAGFVCCLPAVVGKGRALQFRAWTPGAAMTHGPFRIPEPAEDAAPAQPTHLLVPLLAYDRDGYRLGYGGGYYDRSLSARCARRAPSSRWAWPIPGSSCRACRGRRTTSRSTGSSPSAAPCRSPRARPDFGRREAQACASCSAAMSWAAPAATSWRNACRSLREELALDLVIVNGENAAGGFGITPDICKALYQVGADVITLGNHAWDQRGTESYIETDRRLIRARNYPKGTPGSAGALLHTQDGRSVFVFQVLTQLFMDPIGEPFACVEETLQEHRLGQSVDAIVLDIHGEATAEKQALAYLADGRVSLAVGTHTHVPTADHRILPKGTAYISDVGMCGAYESIIGLAVDAPLARFTRKRPGPRAAPAGGDATLCAVLVETDDTTGLARHVGVLRTGGVLTDFWPE